MEYLVGGISNFIVSTSDRPVADRRNSTTLLCVLLFSKSPSSCNCVQYKSTLGICSMCSIRAMTSTEAGEKYVYALSMSVRHRADMVFGLLGRSRDPKKSDSVYGVEIYHPKNASMSSHSVVAPKRVDIFCVST